MPRPRRWGTDVLEQHAWRDQPECHGQDDRLGLDTTPGSPDRFRCSRRSRWNRHADELVVHHRLGERERLRHDPAQGLGTRPVLDDEVLAVDEAVGAGGKAGFVRGMANAVARTASCFVAVSSRLICCERTALRR
jgi:hypothetical protein